MEVCILIKQKTKKHIINISIDLNKIDKSKIKPHANGAKYYHLTIDTLKEPDKFQNTHCVYESQSKEERENKVKRNYIGNGKELIFGNKQNTPPPASNFTTTPEVLDDSLPF